MKKIKGTFFTILLVTLLGLVSGCGSSQTSKNTEDVKKLTIVQMQDENNPDAGTKNNDFRKAMEENLGITVEELVGADYSVGIEAMKSGKLDVLLVSPMSYYQAKKIASIEPLVTTTSMGSEPYKTVFIVSSKDKSTKSLSDLKGKTFAFVDPASSSGYMYPKAQLLKELSLDTNQLENPDYFFKTVAYSGKHDSSVMGVIKGDYDAAAVAAQTIPNLIEAGMISKDDVRIIDETEVIPNACYIIRADLPEKIKDQIKEFYLNYDNASYFETVYGNKNVRFVEAKDEDYASIQDMVKTLNIEEK